MPRKNNNSELWDAISEVGVGRDTAAGAASTIATAVAAGAATFDVVSATGMTAGKILRIGAGSDAEIVVVSSVSTNTITPKYPIAFPHAVGDAVKDQTKTILGVVTDDGVTTDADGDFNAVFGATRRAVFAFAGGHWAPRVDFMVETLSLENLAASLGMVETDVKTSGAQLRLHADASKFGKQTDQWFYWVGVLHDQLTNLEIRAWACEVDYTKALKQKFRRGDSTAAAAPFSVRPINGFEYLLG